MTNFLPGLPLIKRTGLLFVAVNYSRLHYEIRPRLRGFYYTYTSGILTVMVLGAAACFGVFIVHSCGSIICGII